MDSESDEEEESRVGSKSEKDDLDSGSEESKYETDSELGDDDDKEQMESNDPGTPEACFSDEDSIVDALPASDEKDLDREQGNTEEVMFSSDDEEGVSGQSLRRHVADGGDVPDVNKVAEDNKVEVSVDGDTEASVDENAVLEENISMARIGEQLSCEKSGDIVVPQSVVCKYMNN